MAKEKLIGKITHFYNHISVGIIELSASLKAGEEIHVKGANDDFTQKVESIQIEHRDVEEAKKGDVIGIKVEQKVHEGSKVYLV